MRNMKSLLVIGAILATLQSRVGHTETQVSGTISDSAWTSSGSPYIVSGNAALAKGDTLRVDAGVVVKFGVVQTRVATKKKKT